MKKIICLTILTILIINLLTLTSKAENINSADLYSKKYFTGLLKKGDIKLECNMIMYKKDGVEYPAYCLQRELPGVTMDKQYSVDINKLVSDVMIWRTIINGYPYKTITELGCETEEEAFFATKQAVYCAIYNTDPSIYSAQGEAGERCLNALKKIVDAARKSTATKISSDINIVSETSKWEIDQINNKYVSQIFTVEAQAPMNTYKININGDIPEGLEVTDIKNNKKEDFKAGEKFKIVIPLKNIDKDSNFNINVLGKVNTKPVLYGKSANSNFQDYALTTATYEDGTGTKKVYYAKNQTKIIIVKKEDKTEKRLEGVEFEIMDEEQKILYTGLKTNKEGEVEIDNLVPGVYYVHETKTLEGYQIYDKLIKVNLDLNEVTTVNVINSEDNIDINVKEKNTEMTVETKAEEIVVKLPKTGM